MVRMPNQKPTIEQYKKKAVKHNLSKLIGMLIGEYVNQLHNRG